jgi:hypothetical protein
MKSIELQAWTVREYGVQYTVVLDESDEVLQKYLQEHDLTIDDIQDLNFAEQQDLWDYLSNNTEINVDEDFGMNNEHFTDFGSYITERN